MKAEKKILLKGYYDFFNFGDELLLLSIVDFLKEEHHPPANPPALYIERQQRSIERLGHESLPLNEFQEPVRRFVKELRSRRCPGVLVKLLTNLLFALAFAEAILFRLTGQAFLFGKTFRFYRQLDVIHYIGGGYFTDIWDFSLSYLLYELLVTRLARLVNPDLKLVATGWGVGPISRPLYSRLFRRFIAPFTAIHVREPISLDYLKQHDFPGRASCMGDDVQLFFPLFQRYAAENRTSREQGKIFGLNLKADKDHDYSRMKTAIRNLVETLRADGWQIEFFSFGTDHEALAALDEDVRASMTIHKPYEEGMEAFLTHFARIRAGLGFAYHFSVLSALFETPAINVYVGEYYKQKIGEVIRQLSPSQKILPGEAFVEQQPRLLLEDYAVNDHENLVHAHARIRECYRALYRQLLDASAAEPALPETTPAIRAATV